MNDQPRAPDRRRGRSTGRRDLAVIALVAVAVFFLGMATNAYDAVRSSFLTTRYLDEVLGAMLIVVVAALTFGIRRASQAERERALRAETEQQFRTLVEQVPTVTYTWDATRPAGEIPPLYVSPQVERLLGYPSEEWVANPQLWIESMHPDDRDRVIAASDLADRTGEPFVVEYRALHRDGHVVWVHDESNIVAWDERGRPRTAQGVMYDITRYKVAELRRQEAEERYRTIVERVPVVAYTWDGADAPGSAPATYLSPQIEHLLGYEVDAWLSDPTLWQRRMHPDDLERVLGLWNEATSKARPFSAEYRMQRADGEWLWVHDEANPVAPGDRGAPIYQGVILDITEQKRVEQLVRSAEERFRTLVEQIPAITFIEDAVTGENVYISPQIETVLGYSPEEWMADTTLWEQRLHPDDHDWVVAANRQDTEDSWSVDYRSIARDGRVVWLHNDAILIRDEPGNPLFWQGVAFDITERKQAEDRLRLAEERYRSLVEQLPVAIYTDAVDEVSTAIYISPQYEALTGYTAEERMRDRNLWVNMLHPDDRERVLAESLRTNETGDPFDIEYRITAADGRTVWVHDHAILVEDPEGARIWQGVLSDITERTLAQQALSRRDQILEATGFAAHAFLKSPTWSDTIDDVLARLGEAGGASRAYVYANETGADDELLVSLRHAWHAPGWPVDRGAEFQTRFPWRAGGFGRWEELLGSGQVVHGVTSSFPDAERALLEGAGTSILSVIAVPIFVGDDWWGYLGFDHCDEERIWQPAEIEALAVTANTLGAAVGRESAARRLAETQERYQLLVEQMPAVVYVDEHQEGRSGTWPTVYISPQIEQVLGFSRQEWLDGAGLWTERLHPEDRERAVSADATHYRTGEPLDIEIRLIAKDGTVRWVRDQAVMIRDDKGDPRWSQGILLDVTHQKKSEQRLHQAEERYRTLIETIPAATYIDTVTELSEGIYVSPQIERIYGYTPEEWKERTELWEQGLHPDDHDRVVAAVERHNLEGVPYEAEYRFRHRDGRWVWVRDQAVIIRDDDGRPLFSQGVVFDVTEEKEAEQSLREAEERFRGIVEHVPAAIYVDRAARNIESVYVSPQIEDITGVSVEEWLDDPDARSKRMHPDDRDAILGTYLSCAETGTPWSGEYRLQTPDGRTIWVHDETTILHDEEGNPVYIQGVIFDVTERKLAEQALRESEQREREAAERLRALDLMKNTFLAAVSHELRSPLTSILGLALTLERAPQIAESDRGDLLARLAANARKLDRLLKDLLDIDRLNRGIVEPQYRTIDVGALARRTIETLDSLSQREVAIDADALVLSVDPPKVERIVENLMMNAARHTAADRRIWLRVKPHDGGALIAVEDDGPGVPAEIRSAIFEPFHQGTTTSSHSPGTGIGLSLVARFAELHGGRAWVQEREGGGASFRVFLPGMPVVASGNGNGDGRAESLDATGAVTDPAPAG